MQLSSIMYLLIHDCYSNFNGTSGLLDFFEALT